MDNEQQIGKDRSLYGLIVTVVIFIILGTIAFIISQLYSIVSDGNLSNINIVNTNKTDGLAILPAQICPDRILGSSNKTYSFAFRGQEKLVVKTENLDWIKDNCANTLWQSENNQIITDITKNEIFVKAEQALASGLVIDDKNADWISTGKTDDNNTPYQLGFIDIKKLTIAQDDENLYLKQEFAGKIPAKNADLPKLDNDQLKTMRVNFLIDSDNNPKTGNTDFYGSESYISYINRPDEISANDYAEYWVSPGKNPTGHESYENFLHNWQDQILGGKENNYFIIAVPLDKIALQPNQTFTLLAWTQIASTKFASASFDALDTNQGIYHFYVPSIKIKLSSSSAPEIKK